MSEANKRKKDDDFLEFELEFERMREEMEKLMEEMMKHISKEDLNRFTRLGPGGVYGFSVRIGPDGKPIVREFGNVKPNKEDVKLFISEEREPLIDVLDGKDNITVIAEVPGVDKKDVKIVLEDRILQIHVESEKRKYRKDLELPASVDAEKASANYNNGVLEIILPKGGVKSKRREIKII